jgi:putative ABC transport system permease protein
VPTVVPGVARCAPWWLASNPVSPASQATWSPAASITRSHYEAVADVRTGFALGQQRIRIRRHDYTVVGLTRRMVSSGGDPMVFIPLKDAQEAQFLKDNDAIVNATRAHRANPALNRPGVPGLLDAVQASQATTDSSTPSSCRCAPVRHRSRGRPDPPLEAPRGLHARRRWRRS